MLVSHTATTVLLQPMVVLLYGRGLLPYALGLLEHGYSWFIVLLELFRRVADSAIHSCYLEAYALHAPVA
jgi:hypothetical protein